MNSVIGSTNALFGLIDSRIIWALIGLIVVAGIIYGFLKLSGFATIETEYLD